MGQKFNIDNTPWAKMLDAYLTPLRDYKNQRASWWPWNKTTVEEYWLEYWFPDMLYAGGRDAKVQALIKQVEDPNKEYYPISQRKYELYLCFKMEELVSELKEELSDDEAFQAKVQHWHKSSVSMQHRIDAYNKIPWYQKRNWPKFWELTKEASREAEAIAPWETQVAYWSLFKPVDPAKPHSKMPVSPNVQEMRDFASGKPGFDASNIWQKLTEFFATMYENLKGSKLLSSIYNLQSFLSPVMASKASVQENANTAQSEKDPKKWQLVLYRPSPEELAAQNQASLQAGDPRKAELSKLLTALSRRFAHLENRKELKPNILTDYPKDKKVKMRKQLLYVLALPYSATDKELKEKLFQVYSQIAHPDKLRWTQDDELINTATECFKNLAKLLENLMNAQEGEKLIEEFLAKQRNDFQRAEEMKRETQALDNEIERTKKQKEELLAEIAKERKEQEKKLEEQDKKFIQLAAENKAQEEKFAAQTVFISSQEQMTLIMKYVMENLHIFDGVTLNAVATQLKMAQEVLLALGKLWENFETSTFDNVAWNAEVAKFDSIVKNPILDACRLALNVDKEVTHDSTSHHASVSPSIVVSV